MPFDKNLLLPYLSQDPKAVERVGFVMTDGTIVEVENVCHDPVNGFEISGAELIRYIDKAASTWHTHPGVDSNLSFGDYQSFLNYPDLTHYIAGTDGVTEYTVAKGKVLIAP